MNKTLKEQLMEKDTSGLDDIVHDAASVLGSNANNEGLDGQIRFLTETCGWSEDDILKAVENDN